MACFPLSAPSAQRGNLCLPPRRLTAPHNLGLIASQPARAGTPTDELLPHLVPLPEVVRAEDEGVDDAEERDHVRDVICGLQLVHDDTEAILLRLDALKEKSKSVETIT